MKAIVCDAFEAPLVLRELPDPEAPEDGVVIRLIASGICRSDLHSWHGHWPEGATFPMVLGHVVCGEIVALGPAVRNRRVGQRVTVPFCDGCGACESCLSGHHNTCDFGSQYGLLEWGGFAELMAVVRADLNTIVLPDAVGDLAAAALGCRFMTAFHGLTDVAAAGPGEWLAVHGCGGVGLSAVQIAVALGARVIAVDIDAEKLDMARELGAEVTLNAHNADPVEAIRDITRGGAQVSVDALGIAATCRNSIRGLRKRGRHVQIGLTSKAEKGEVLLPVDDIIGNEWRILGSLGMPVGGYPRLLAMVEAGRLDPARLVSQRVALGETPAVMAAMEDYGTLGFAVIDRFDA